MIDLVSLHEFGQRFGCEVVTLPGNVVALGWSANDGVWSCGPERNSRTPCYAERVFGTLGFIEQYVLPRLAARSFWFLLCFWDGWRERHSFSDRYTWVPQGS